MRKKIAALLMVLALTACAEAPREIEAPATEYGDPSVEESTEVEIHEDPGPPEPDQAEILALRDEVLLQTIREVNPGYPLIVSVDSLDTRIADEYRAAGVTQAVALLPAAYVPYVDNEDPDYYLLTANGATGSCLTLEWLEGVKQTIYEGIDESRATMSYTCLDGVETGPEEPNPGEVW